MYTFREYVDWWLANHNADANIDYVFRRYQQFGERYQASIHHLNGDPTDNSIDNLILVTDEDRDCNPKHYPANTPGNVSQAEAIMANLCVLRVSFSAVNPSEEKRYSYLAPIDFDVKQDPFVVVPSHDANPETRTDADKFIGTDFKVARVIEVVSVVDDQYDGNYKRIVAGFNPIDFMTFNVNQAKKKKLLDKLKKMSEEVSTLATLEKLLGDNPEAKSLLDEYKKL